MTDNLFKRASIDVLQQLVELLRQLEDLQYTDTLEILSDNTIGKHARHIIEFFTCVLKSLHTGIVAYDLRERNLQLENSIAATIQTIQCLTDTITAIEGDQPVSLHCCLYTEEKLVQIPSTFYREMIYTIEHAVHHMAIIRMAVQSTGWSVKLPDNFGVAQATIQYKTHMGKYK